MSNNENRVGVALTLCFYCGKGDAIVINKKLTKRMKKKVEAIHGKVINLDPCSKCKKYMDEGIIVIAYDAEKTEDLESAYRTGGWWVVTEDFINKIADFFKDDNQVKEAMKNAIDKRFLFMDDRIAKGIGLYDFVNDDEDTESEKK